MSWATDSRRNITVSESLTNHVGSYLSGHPDD